MSSIDDDLDDDIKQTEKEKTELQAVTEILLNDLYKRRKTILRDRVISALTTIDVLATMFDVKFLQEWIEGYTEYVTSVNGQGRKDIVDITKFRIDKEAERDKAIIESFGRR